MHEFSGLLAGLWEFPSYTIEDDKLTSEIQQSFIPLVIDRITNALNSSLNITSINELNVKPIGEV